MDILARVLESDDANLSRAFSNTKIQMSFSQCHLLRCWHNIKLHSMPLLSPLMVKDLHNTSIQIHSLKCVIPSYMSSMSCSNHHYDKNSKTLRCCMRHCYQLTELNQASLLHIYAVLYTPWYKMCVHCMVCPCVMNARSVKIIPMNGNVLWNIKPLHIISWIIIEAHTLYTKYTFLHLMKMYN